MMGEALMTQGSATLEILFQILDAHLNGRNLMLVKHVKKLPAFKTQHFRSLSLRKPPFLKPLYHGCFVHVATKLRWFFTQDNESRFRDFDCHLLGHGDKLADGIESVKM